jgi:hypothetical protein
MALTLLLLLNLGLLPLSEHRPKLVAGIAGVELAAVIVATLLR